MERRPVRAWADPQDRPQIGGKVGVGGEAHRAVCARVPAGGGVQKGNIDVWMSAANTPISRRRLPAYGHGPNRKTSGDAVKDRDFLRCRQIGVPQAPFDYFGVKAAHAVCQGLRVLPGRCMQDDLPATAMSITVSGWMYT